MTSNRPHWNANDPSSEETAVSASTSKYKMLGAKFAEFCKRTDLHGFKYIVMDELNRVERTCWAFAVLLSIMCAAHFVVTAYKWYARNPIVTVIESTQGPIWDIPFPAVMICDLNKVSRKAAFEFAYNLSLPVNISAEFVFKTLPLTPLLHSPSGIAQEVKRDLSVLQDVLDYNDVSIEALFKLLAPSKSCTEFLQRCMWKNTIYRCEQLFELVYTAINICCIFNYFALEEKDEQKKLKSDLIYMTSPRRVASCGYQTALTVLLNVEQDDYYSTSVATTGVVVFIDSAYNVPNLDSTFRFVNPSTEVLMALSPERTYATKGIKSFTPEQRLCYYHDEIKISNFRQYSYHNCVAYQKIEIIRNTCNCVPYFYPSENKETRRVCSFRDLECLEDVLKPQELLRRISEENYRQCLPECEHYDYPLEVALGKLAATLPLHGLPFFANVNLENRSVVNVFFNDLVSTRYRRDVYLNWQNILAAFGGLLSLMLGFTLISGVDFILFLMFNVIYEWIIMKFPRIGRSQRNKPYQSSVIQVEVSKKQAMNNKIVHEEHRTNTNYQPSHKY